MTMLKNNLYFKGMLAAFVMIKELQEEEGIQCIPKVYIEAAIKMVNNRTSRSKPMKERLRRAFNYTVIEY